MKKREQVKKKDNLIYFPDLEKRLTEKGLESLQTKKYSDAINYLEKASELEPENEDVLAALVIAYFEATQYSRAKKLAKEMLMTGMGDYYQMVELYLAILIQLHEYDEIVSTIEALLEEKDISIEKYNHFLTILKFCRRMAENSPITGEGEEMSQRPLTSVDRPHLNLFSLKDPNDQMMLISELADKNIRPFLKEISEYLSSETGHPFLKTLLLNLLKDQGYNQRVDVCKFGLKNRYVPAELPDIDMQPRMMAILEHLREKTENSNPILFENIKSLVERHFLIAYPFQQNPSDTIAWAAAFHLTALEYYGDNPESQDFSYEYGVSSKEIEEAAARIKEIEEISYPII